MTTPPILLDPAIGAALDAGAPVVALESTIITHGMPWPDNLAMLERVESAVRDHGATPATIAVMDGTIRIGLSAAEARALAKTDGALKLSRADLAFACAQGLTGGTTVAATMMAAHGAGIAVFATGGIGGVHQGAETDFDISADLDELARTPVTVVSAGAKAILDIPKTLEALETRGVPVIAVGQDEMPAFWSRGCGLDAPLRLDDADAIARFLAIRAQLTDYRHGGVLVANPVPTEAEIPHAEMAGFITQAQAEAAERGIKGKHVTPWLLARIVEITGSRSLATNIALVENNARLGAEIAVALTGR
ncbi:MAG: pseudouridine-5'-phosphate glycosidase [Roseitalea sp.]|jgi:pseudouridine-5'-phosphate glycosidase|nr:pseudouridine-5'-phosphate glycosidase [Roseitalea sp.]MBO6723815.1 pseudouridine-5'-phosphate glycosidase [Roseitalea sp.]MBO6744708.1 pseudouridine-5'-phosphate glycosidase [Roseitalea sp.]